MNENFMELMVKAREKAELAGILKWNEKTAQFGLTMTEEEAGLLLAGGRASLKEQGRVELGGGIFPALIAAFCDSPYISQSNYVETLTELADIFYLFKNESCDCLTDDELMQFMKEQFDGVCFGSPEYLADTCLERFSRAIRAGYSGYRGSGGRREYGKFEEEKRWDRDLYLEALMDQF